MINVSFTTRVGVSPGTTTIALDGQVGGNLRCTTMRGPGATLLGAADAPCLPEPIDAHMTWPGSAGGPAATGVPVASNPYGTDSTMNGALGAHSIDRRQGMRRTFKGRGLRGALGISAPFGLSWGSFGTILAVAIGGGAGLAYLAERPHAAAPAPSSAAIAGARRYRRR